jgi:Flp pilus assembly protein TadD
MKFAAMVMLAASLALTFAAPIHADPAPATTALPEPDSRMKSAGALLSDGKYSDAIHAYQEIISSDSKNALAWIGLGLAYRHAGQRDLARAAFDEAISIDPSRKAQLSELMPSPK